MGDLMQSLITPHSSQSSQPQPLHPTSSNESFHSTGSQQPHAAPHPPPTVNRGKGNLPIFDMGAYLSDPANAALLASTINNASTSSSSSSKRQTHPDNGNPQQYPPPPSSGSSGPPAAAAAIPLGTATSHHVSNLNTLCQAKGLPTPIYEIVPAGDAPPDRRQQHHHEGVRFSGFVRVGTEMVGSEQRWRNKKEAREGLAQRAVPIVTAMAGRRVRQGSSGGGGAGGGAGITAAAAAATSTAGQGGDGGAGKNWVGMLQEYHNATYGGSQSPLYSYYQVEGKFFGATCAVPAYPGRTFGSATKAFATKKAAQGAAAQEAVEALMAEGKVSADGSTAAGGRKKSKGDGSGDGGGGGGVGPCVRLTDAGLMVSKGGSFAQRVSDMALLFGLSAPQYHIEPASAAAPSLLNGYAMFNGVPALQGPVGEVRNVYGKKNAKEEVAKGVWEVLKGIAASRGFEPKEI